MIVKKYYKVKKCWVCAESEFEEIGSSKCPILNEKCKLIKCLSCGFVFLNPTPDEDEVGKIYSFIYRHGDSNTLAKLLNYYIMLDFRRDAKLISKFKTSGKVLDVGYGSGEMLNSLKGEWEKHGYDAYSKKKDRDLIREKLGIVAHATKNELKDNYFDLVILRNVIEHTVEFEKLFKLAFQKLKKGGALFIRTPNINSLDFRIFKNNWYMTYMGGHIVFFNNNTLEKVAKRNGFRNKMLYTTMSSPPMSFARSLRLQFNIKNDLIIKLIMPLSLLYSLVSSFIGSGNDLLAVYKKN